jgi:hypothetical protein
MGAGREDAASFPGGKKQMSVRCASIKGWGAILMVLSAISAVERGSGADGEGPFAPLGGREKFFGAGQGRREEGKGLSVRLQSGGFLKLQGFLIASLRLSECFGRAGSGGEDPVYRAFIHRMPEK